MKKQSIEFWKNVILSEKKIEPRDESEAAIYDIAEYFVRREQQKKAA